MLRGHCASRRCEGTTTASLPVLVITCWWRRTWKHAISILFWTAFMCHHSSQLPTFRWRSCLQLFYEWFKTCLCPTYLLCIWWIRTKLCFRINFSVKVIYWMYECQPRKVDIQFVQKNVMLLAIRTWGQQVILMPYMDSQIQNSFRKTNNSPTERIFMLDL